MMWKIKSFSFILLHASMWHSTMVTPDVQLNKTHRSYSDINAGVFVYYSYLNVAVLALMIVETKVLICANEGFCIWRRSLAILLRAVLSKTITQSALSVNLFSVNRELYGCTTTSLINKKHIVKYIYSKWLINMHCTQ